LINDPHSGYRQWPSEPPSGAPQAVNDGQPNGQPPQPNEEEPPQTPIADLIQELIPLSPTPECEQVRQPSAPVSPVDPALAAPTVNHAQYASPYGQPPPVQPQPPLRQPAAAQAPSAEPPTASYNTRAHGIADLRANVAQQLPPQQGPSLQPATPPGVILSRTRETKILLSIDGDGIRGLSALLLLESLVNAICVKIGQRLDPHQIFDLTGGSSLGGVIALLVCRLQMQPHRAREAYKKISRQVYFNKRDFFISLEPSAPLLGGDAKALDEEIKEVIQQELGTGDDRLFDGREDSGDV
jgi:hypothetical protein